MATKEKVLHRRQMRLAAVQIVSNSGVRISSCKRKDHGQEGMSEHGFNIDLAVTDDFMMERMVTSIEILTEGFRGRNKTN